SLRRSRPRTLGDGVFVGPLVTPGINIVLVATTRRVFPFFFSRQAPLHAIALRTPRSKVDRIVIGNEGHRKEFLPTYWLFLAGLCGDGHPIRRRLVISLFNELLVLVIRDFRLVHHKRFHAHAVNGHFRHRRAVATHLKRAAGNVDELRIKCHWFRCGLAWFFSFGFFWI